MPVANPLGTGGDSRDLSSAEAGRRHGRRRLAGRLLAALLLSGLAVEGALAQRLRLEDAENAARGLGALEVIQLAIFAGVMGAALVLAVWMIRERQRIATENSELRTRVADLSSGLQRTEALLNIKDQRIVIWPRGAARPDLAGGLPVETGAPDDRAAFLAFGRWLAPRSAASLEAALAALREAGQAFDLVLETQSGLHLEAVGRLSAGQAVLRLFSLTEARKAHARLRLEHQKLESEYVLLRGAIDAVQVPVWMRGPDGRIAWVNPAYAAAVDAPAPELAVLEGRELLATRTRQALDEAHRQHAAVTEKVSAVVRGDRRQFVVTEVAGADGAAGIAVDRSEEEALIEERTRVTRSHAETLDQLTTAIAIFDSSEKLRFHNQAFQALWDLDAGFLESAPDNTLLLDRLRSEGKLSEQPEWRKWKEAVLSAYRAPEKTEEPWHLPDGRTIRVIANPHPSGGVTWIFENLTERIDLESRYNTAVRVQTETLDNLAEGVAVFGPDGRLRLANPAFSSLWGIDTALARPGVHISSIRDAVTRTVRESPWPLFAATVTGFEENREDAHGQAELADGSVLRHALIHLPNGHTMLTFVDVTDSVNVERALKDKNEALQNADRLKNDFVQHVSYELRSPLTNIIGFTELLLMPDTGPLNRRQRDYVGHIGSSSAVLLSIVNDILDLATVDAGIMRLELGEVVIREAIAAAADRVAERLRDHDIRLSVGPVPDSAVFRADGNRIRQILANLLSNAANFAPSGSTVTLAFRHTDRELRFAVHDDGPGIPPEVLDAVYRRFEPRTNGGRRRGAGLGLSIVKSFVELHGGRVEIETGKGAGTTVTCIFPLKPGDYMEAAE